MGFSLILLFFLLLLAVAFLAATVACIPKVIVKTAPKDIQEKVLARPDYPKWRTALGFALAALIAQGIASILLWADVDAVQKEMGFGAICGRYLILLCGYKLFDMVCFDCLLLTKLNVFQRFFPETVGCEGYEHFGFNLKSQLIKLAVFAAVSFLIAAVLSRL